MLQKEPTNVDAINSIAACVKQKAAARNKGIGGPTPGEMSLFHQLCSLYYESLRIDPEDVEANFNLAMMHLQQSPTGQPDFAQALKFFLQAVQKDR